MRTKYNTHFYNEYNSGFNEFVRGDWKEAARSFEMAEVFFIY
jgi:hypothetical protein